MYEKIEDILNAYDLVYEAEGYNARPYEVEAHWIYEYVVTRDFTTQELAQYIHDVFKDLHGIKEDMSIFRAMALEIMEY